MPTGYTEIIEQKPDLTFEEFALRCARAFGALVTMREDRLDAPLPGKLVPDRYYEQQITKAKERIAEVEAMTDAEAERSAATFYTLECVRREQYIESQRIKIDRYDAMRAKVEAWTPPTEDHVGLKTFMLDQINLSTRGERDWQPRVPTRVSGALYRAGELQAAKDALARAEKGWADELARTDERNAWIAVLLESLRAGSKEGASDE